MSNGKIGIRGDEADTGERTRMEESEGMRNMKRHTGSKVKDVYLATET